jgi:hypothetical protein
MPIGIGEGIDAIAFGTGEKTVCILNSCCAGCSGKWISSQCAVQHRAVHNSGVYERDFVVFSSLAYHELEVSVLEPWQWHHCTGLMTGGYRRQRNLRVLQAPSGPLPTDSHVPWMFKVI